MIEDFSWAKILYSIYLGVIICISIVCGEYLGGLIKKEQEIDDE